MDSRHDESLVTRVLALVDRVFLVTFARYRRPADSDITSAWRSACFRVSGYLILPTAGTIVLLSLLYYRLIGFGLALSPLAERVTLVIVVVVGLMLAVLLDRRFKKFLADPPPLGGPESQSDRLLLFRYRATTLAVAIFVGVLIILVREVEGRVG